LTKSTVCPATPRKALLHAAYRGNIDIKNVSEILDKLLNIKKNYSVIKFILAKKVDMPPGDQRKNARLRWPFQYQPLDNTNK
jgi:hypothetical protein